MYAYQPCGCEEMEIDQFRSDQGDGMINVTQLFF